MIIRRFLLWARTAPSQERAAAAGALARSYLQADLDPADRQEAETALFSLLDDPSPAVRRALADVLCQGQAPHGLILALAQDQAEIAARVLSFSPMLSEADLVDAVAMGCDAAQAAVARRQDVGVALAAAIAEVGGVPAVTVLLQNPHAVIGRSSIARIAERFGREAEVREALLDHADLPPAIRHRLALDLAETLRAFVGGCGWLPAGRLRRVTEEATDRVALDLAARPDPDGLADLVSHLRAAGRLTPALLLRSLLEGETALAERAFCDLTGLPMARVSALLHDRRGAGMAPLCRKAGLPEALTPAFAAAVRALGELDPALRGRDRPGRLIARVLIACETAGGADNAALMAWLRRLETELARERARDQAAALADDAALAMLLEIDPLLLLDDVGGQALAA